MAYTEKQGPTFAHANALDAPNLRGRVNARRDRRNPDRCRLRFVGVPTDSAQLILDALRVARREAETNLDWRALECICLDYLAGRGHSQTEEPK